MSNTAFPAATIVGYPRVGRFRELKKAQEAFWKGKATLQELQDTAADVQRTYFERVTAAGLKADNYSIPATFSTGRLLSKTAASSAAGSHTVDVVLAGTSASSSKLPSAPFDHSLRICP